MTVNLICQAVIPMYTGLPTDVITNSWSFHDSGVGTDFEAAADAINPFVQAFYDSIYDNVPNYLMSPSSTWEARWYNRDAPPPRAVYVLPLRTTGFTAAGSAIPTETACVLSFQGVRVSGQVQARRRGRVYLGGLPPASIDQSTSTSYPIFQPTFVNDVVAAAAALRDGLEATPTYRWVVWSTASAGWTEVSDGWVDNSPDTQRRRSVDATLRTTW